MRPLLLRADASETQGLGHLARCLALGQAWRSAGGAVLLVTTAPGPRLRSRLESEGFQLVESDVAPGTLKDAQLTLRHAEQAGAAWIALDGYEFGTEYQRVLRDGSGRLLVIDDHGRAGRYHADLVLDQNIGAIEQAYRHRDPDTRLLLGPRHALLRREFSEWRRRGRTIETLGRRVLVSLGGADPPNMTLRVLRGLALLASSLPLDIRVVIGPANPYVDSIRLAAGGLPCRILDSPPDMAEQMAWADLAIAAAGSSSLEMACLGLPSLVVSIAPNQEPVAQAMERHGVARHIGPHGSLDAEAIADATRTLIHSPQERAMMSAAGRELVDGAGAARTAFLLRSALIRLRAAAPEDCRLVWEWANDPETRHQSFASEPIAWEQHLQWYAAALASPGRRMHVAEDDAGRPVAQVRLDVEGDEAVISISVEARCRGTGLGGLVIHAACGTAFEQLDVAAIDAYIKPGNEASLKAFAKAGFERQSGVEFQGQAAVRMRLARAGYLGAAARPAGPTVPVNRSQGLPGPG